MLEKIMLTVTEVTEDMEGMADTLLMAMKVMDMEMHTDMEDMMGIEGMEDMVVTVDMEVFMAYLNTLRISKKNVSANSLHVNILL
jgi:hypothetical protein